MPSVNIKSSPLVGSSISNLYRRNIRTTPAGDIMAISKKELRMKLYGCRINRSRVSGKDKEDFGMMVVALRRMLKNRAN